MSEEIAPLIVRIYAGELLIKEVHDDRVAAAVLSFAAKRDSAKPNVEKSDAPTK